MKLPLFFLSTGIIIVAALANGEFVTPPFYVAITVADATSLQGAGCDVSHVGTVDCPTGIGLIFVEDSGQNSIMVVPGANAEYRPADLQGDADAFLGGAAAVLLQLETPIETVAAAALAARRAGVRVILDPAPAQPGLLADLVRAVDILMRLAASGISAQDFGSISDATGRPPAP